MEVLKEIFAKFPEGFMQGLLMNGVVVSLVYLIVWKWLGKRFANWRIQLNQRVDAAQIKSEIKNAFWVFAVGALFSSIVFWLSTKGYTKLYSNYSEHSPVFAWAGFFIIILIDDAWFYFTHRLMHHPKLYRYVHAMPTYLPVLGLVQVYGLFENIKGHLGYEFFPSWWNKSWLRFMTSSTHHNMHHHKFNGNYGIHFRFWDKLFSTEFKDYETEYDTIQARKKGVVQTNIVNAVEATIANVTVDYKGTNTVGILKDETVLAALLRNNIQAPNLCQEGICGTCKCKLVRGEVTMKTRDALTDAEIKDGYILICQSVPKSNLVEIKID
jgi:Delta7-sterol 5-desaturase